MAAPTPTITPPIDLWGSPIWNPLNVLIAFITLVVSIIPIGLWLITRQKKELSYLWLSDTSVVNINKGFAEKVKVSYLGIPSKTLQLVRFKIINTGNQPINPEDFKVPLTFFPDKQIKNGKVTGLNILSFPETSPKDLNPEIINHNKRLGIKPLLLNRGDSITVELINIDEYDNKAILDVQGGISGVKIKEIKPKEINQFKPTDYLLISFLRGITLSITVYLISTFTISNYLLSFPDSEFFFRYLLPIIALIISILLSLIIKYKNFFLEQAE
jgi:hypothetical protein